MLCFGFKGFLWWLHQYKIEKKYKIENEKYSQITKKIYHKPKLSHFSTPSRTFALKVPEAKGPKTLGCEGWPIWERSTGHQHCFQKRNVLDAKVWSLHK